LKVLEANSQVADAHFQLGLIFYNEGILVCLVCLFSFLRLGALALATGHFQKAIELNVEFGPLLKNLTNMKSTNTSSE
jgi:hypothetical protein